MPRRSSVALADIASHDTLVTAFWQAAKKKRHREEVRHFASRLDRELTSLRDDILAERVPDGKWTSFHIHDPKPRRILARGEVGAMELQSGFSAALAITAHAEAHAFRAAELSRRSAVDG